MNDTLKRFVGLDDERLLDEVHLLATQERRCTAHLIAALAEVDARKLYAGEGCSSLFTYCTQVLRLSEHAAYGRIEAARAARRFPRILPLLESGDITLTTVTLLAPHLTSDNHEELLRAATRKNKRDVEQIVAAIRPKPDIPSHVRKLPAARPTGRSPVCPAPVMQPARERATTSETQAPRPDPKSAVRSCPPPRAVVAPLAPERFKIQFTASRETHDKLRRVQDLLRHAIPNGDVSAIFDRALTLLLSHTERTKIGATSRRRGDAARQSSSRHVPAAVRREVWARDGGRCAFVGGQGRCTERGFLEFHHMVPDAEGGQTTVENLELRCRAHNVFEAERHFGSVLTKSGAPTLF